MPTNMPTKSPRVLERLKAAYKTFTQGNWIASDLPGNIYSSQGNRTGRMHWVPGSAVNWDLVTGELWMCPAVQACLNWLFRNGTQAPPIIQEKDASGNWSTVEHVVTDLLKRPNPKYDWSLLFQGFDLSAETNGNAYIIFERNNGGQIGEMWWAPHHLVRPVTDPGNDPRIVDYYQYWIGPKPVEIPTEDMFHFKVGIDPADERLGLSPLASAARDVNALQRAGNYRPTILDRFGVIGRTVSSEDPTVTIDPKQVKEYIDSNSQGDKNGSTLVFDFKAKIDYPKTTPQDMALTTLEDRPEADICALVGLPIQVTGLHGGREAKTYANMKEAREAAWEEKLMPLFSMIGCQLGYRLLTEFAGTNDRKALKAYLSKYRLTFDYSEIRPLQPDLDKIHDRARNNWIANLITLEQWYQMVGEPEPTGLPDWETLKVMRYRDLSGGPVVEDPNNPNAPNQPSSPSQPQNKPKPSGKSLDWAERVIGEIEALHAESALVGTNGVH